MVRIIYIVFFLIFSASALTGLHTVLIHVSENERIIFNDPMLTALPAMDLSSFIFCLTYIPIIFFLVLNIKSRKYLLFIQSYILIVALRIITIYFFPLEEPAGAIMLNDPLLNHTFYPDGYSPYDLFFSGHVAAIFILYFLEGNKKNKWIYLLAGIILSVMLMIQHVHYSVDVIAAPLFAYLSVRLINTINLRLFSSVFHPEQSGHQRAV